MPGGWGEQGALPSSGFKAKYLIPACKQLVSGFFVGFVFLFCFFSVFYDLIVEKNKEERYLQSAGLSR